MEWVRATALAISAAATGSPSTTEMPGAETDPASIENMIETGRHGDATSGLDWRWNRSGPDNSLAGSWPPGPAVPDQLERDTW